MANKNVTDVIRELVSGQQTENRKIEKGVETIKVDRRKFNKGHPNSGRKPKEVKIIERGIKEWIDDHAKEKLMVTVTDPKTGLSRQVEKTRLMIALEKLYAIGVSGAGNTDAIDKWLNRMVGRPAQPIVGDDTNPVVLRLDF